MAKTWLQYFDCSPLKVNTFFLFFLLQTAHKSYRSSPQTITLTEEKLALSDITRRTYAQDYSRAPHIGPTDGCHGCIVPQSSAELARETTPQQRVTMPKRQEQANRYF